MRKLDLIESVGLDLASDFQAGMASFKAKGIAGPIQRGFELVDTSGGLSRGEIHEEWWNRALEVVTDSGLPSYFQSDGSLQGLGQDVAGVFFIDGGPGGSSQDRWFRVPYGDTLAIPLRNIVVLADPGEDPVADAAEFFETIDPDLLRLSVDGKEIPLADLLDTRAQSGSYETVVEAGGFLDGFPYPFTAAPEDQAPLEPGDTVPSAADGYLVLLDGLDPGRHTLEFGYFDDDGEIEDGEVMVTADVLVLPDAAYQALNSADEFSFFG